MRIEIDDGRRWLARHPEGRFDLIVANITFHWREHATNLLSREFLALVRRHLALGGAYYYNYNATSSPDAMKTGFTVFVYGLRFGSFIAVSDAPVRLDRDACAASLVVDSGRAPSVGPFRTGTSGAPARNPVAARPKPLGRPGPRDRDARGGSPEERGSPRSSPTTTMASEWGFLGVVRGTPTSRAVGRRVRAPRGTRAGCRSAEEPGLRLPGSPAPVHHQSQSPDRPKYQRPGQEARIQDLEADLVQLRLHNVLRPRSE